MSTRWLMAAVGALALALLTLRADLPASIRRFAGGAPAKSGCPVEAKPANFNFTLRDANDKEVKLGDFKGKVVLLNFWATWCGPCKVEIPWFVEFQERYGKKGFQVVGVSVDDTAEKLRPYIQNLKVNYPMLIGLNHDDIQDAYGPMLGIPVTVMIGRDGKICGKHTGLTGKDDFEQEIKALL